SQRAIRPSAVSSTSGKDRAIRSAPPAPPGTVSKRTSEIFRPAFGYSVPSMSSRLMSSLSDAPSSSAYSTDRHSPAVIPDSRGIESKEISKRSVSYGCARERQAAGPEPPPSLSNCGCEPGTRPPAAVPQPHHSQIRNPALFRPSEIAISFPRSPAQVTALLPFASDQVLSNSSAPRNKTYAA